ncbi:copine-8-like [Capricornis sumatraensis]|uniref:copine-8-like n=1 Tax=Capricornis sumatraensis TaxID=34865 RepID=UPI003604AC99
MVERYDRMWSSEEGNCKPLQYSSLENAMNSMKSQKDRTLKMNSPVYFYRHYSFFSCFCYNFLQNGNPQNPYCNGVDGVMEAYYRSLKSVQLYGPTNFAPVINHVARYAASVKDGSQYFVLLIVTDGVISDMAQTKESIVNASKLPMSIIIVGVGPAEFDAMVELDGDDVRVSSRGKYAERDIVQFVPFRDYIDRSGNHILSMARLAKDVLAEIPEQFLSYMRARGIKPSPAPPPYTPSTHVLQTQILLCSKMLM